MHHSTIEDNDIILRYVQGKLAAEEAECFEEHYFDCPECLEALELTQRLEEGLKGMAAQEGAQLTQVFLLGWLMRRGRGFQSAFVLTLLTLIVAPWLILSPRVSRLSSDVQLATAPHAGALTWRLSSERSGGVDEEPSAQIELRETSEWLTLSLAVPPFPDASFYRVGVSKVDGESLWQSPALEGEIGGKIDLRLHSTWLEGGDYRVELEALPSNGKSGKGALVATYFFRVRLPA